MGISVAIWALNTTDDIWNLNIGMEIIYDTKFENEHQKRQLGVFINNNSPSNNIEEFIEYCSQTYNVENTLFKILIPWEERNIVLVDLYLIGINHLSLFSGLEGCANTVLLNEIINRNL